jgi:hypothetical protein
VHNLRILCGGERCIVVCRPSRSVCAYSRMCISGWWRAANAAAERKCSVNEMHGRARNGVESNMRPRWESGRAQTDVPATLWTMDSPANAGRRVFLVRSAFVICCKDRKLVWAHIDGLYDFVVGKEPLLQAAHSVSCTHHECKMFDVPCTTPVSPFPPRRR